MGQIEDLNRRIVNCSKCKRLRRYCAEVARTKRASFQNWDYWGKPVPNFGPSRAALLIVGLAPAAHGGNRTGRMFTGDNSGKWLYRSLHRNGFAASDAFESADDGQKLRNCLVTAVAHCAPPDNRPSPEEIAACEPFFRETFSQAQPRVIVTLGQIAWKATFQLLRDVELWKAKIPKFAHGIEIKLDQLVVIGSYHPSQQNTFTGRLTEEMLDRVFAAAKKSAL